MGDKDYIGEEIVIPGEGIECDRILIPETIEDVKKIKRDLRRRGYYLDESDRLETECTVHRNAHLDW